MRIFLAVLVAAVVAVWLAATFVRSPARVLWVWERPEDLSSANPLKTKMAVLVKSIEIAGAEVRVRPRMQPVKLPPNAETIAVVRIEVVSPIASPAAVERRIAREIAGAIPDATRSVQVDFDARVSERAFYRGLLERLHEELSRDVRLSITALASWCLDDPWIRDLPVDEAVPMLFRMGPDRDAVLDYLASGGDFKVDLCRHSAGLSLDEPVYRVPRGRTLYFFSPGRWTPQLIETAANGRFLQ